MSRTRNAVYGQPYRGFESLFFRRKVKSKEDKIKSSPLNSVNLMGFFYIYSLMRKTGKKSEKNKMIALKRTPCFKNGYGVRFVVKRRTAVRIWQSA